MPLPRLAPRCASLVVALAACGSPAAPPRVAAPAAVAPRPLSGAPKPGGVAFERFDKSAFERAAREDKIVLLDGAAEWCHWCHVMDAETYHDPRVVAALAKGFVVTRVDIDERPDVQERYADYGWPATILFAKDGTELAAYKGFLSPERLLEVLDAAARPGSASAPAQSKVAAPRGGRGALTAADLAREERTIAARLDAFYDEREGGYGTFQKAPLGWNNAWLLRGARAGDARARARAITTLEKQSALLDPVWGGVYQYSDGATWEHPHYEKLMTFQAPALENYAEAYALTRDPKMLARARLERRYMSEILRRDGVFGATQDADLNAHEPGKPYLTGHEYYALGEAGRRAAGLPRVERRAYAKENGLAIAAYVTFAEATGDVTATAEALDTARRILASHRLPEGGFSHEARAPGSGPATIYLADNALFGLALVRLYEATHERSLLEAASSAAARLLADTWDEANGGFYASSRDPHAVGVFQRRRMPLDENAFAVRFLVRLARVTRDPALAEIVGRALFATLTPENLDDRGRMLGEVLLAVAEARELLAAPPAR
ncbi:MAG TPA: DUF255 domain-containing protein [Polyangiaceae bacterium]|nr:DUF255 domain-containing protein [Polyangiaceae bacterium]